MPLPARLDMAVGCGQLVLPHYPGLFGAALVAFMCDAVVPAHASQKGHRD